MARRLIVDTGVLVAAERARPTAASAIDPEDDVVVAAITVAALLTGVELAAGDRRTARAAYVEQVLAVLPVEPYDEATARAHARLLAHVHRCGAPRGAHDLVIAATAVATGRTVLTTDRRAWFDELPEVSCVVVD